MTSQVRQRRPPLLGGRPSEQRNKARPAASAHLGGRRSLSRCQQALGGAGSGVLERRGRRLEGRTSCGAVGGAVGFVVGVGDTRVVARRGSKRSREIARARGETKRAREMPNGSKCRRKRAEVGEATAAAAAAANLQAAAAISLTSTACSLRSFARSFLSSFLSGRFLCVLGQQRISSSPVKLSRRRRSRRRRRERERGARTRASSRQPAANSSFSSNSFDSLSLCCHCLRCSTGVCRKTDDKGQ